jgi:hypothetical protein
MKCQQALCGSMSIRAREEESALGLGRAEKPIPKDLADQIVMSLGKRSFVIKEVRDYGQNPVIS